MYSARNITSYPKTSRPAGGLHATLTREQSDTLTYGMYGLLASVNRQHLTPHAEERQRSVHTFLTPSEVSGMSTRLTYIARRFQKRYRGTPDDTRKVYTNAVKKTH
ncbi:uncharacterized protein BDZ99DRAFT_55203 [Mytilinidion resinicola]|uniref:Uncharacterized protein n=1 Tax=Mytilinidion resinicola TaxID=574789 RepID=A0A6A6YKD2_9PEZI|nr:uncharacterized protein BDZ99DRAFT_55203 [Mytilinidion resinicola]KAF2808415.1 hypothetical protein BDZ99DRAFT_55203 [Mytilinidion resinicola]